MTDARWKAKQDRKRMEEAAPELCRELRHLVRLLEPLEQSGELNVPGLATLNGPRNAITKSTGEPL